jgi:hypothetical protein
MLLELSNYSSEIGEACSTHSVVVANTEEKTSLGTFPFRRPTQVNVRYVRDYAECVWTGLLNNRADGGKTDSCEHGNGQDLGKKFSEELQFGYLKFE